jgi:hypothetical protein|nr:MAG TPA: Mechanosensitive ion channel [Caudoviricetes sp.]
MVQIGLGDTVTINGVSGVVDFIGAEIIILETPKGQQYKTDISDIQSVEITQSNTLNQLCFINLEI